MKKQLFSRKDNLFEFIIIPVNRESTYPEQLANPVKDGDELDIVFTVGGG